MTVIGELACSLGCCPLSSGGQRGNRFQMDVLLRVACLLAAAVLPYAPLEGCRYTPTALHDARLFLRHRRANNELCPKSSRHLPKEDI
jgi:hypothetical protein